MAIRKKNLSAGSARVQAGVSLHYTNETTEAPETSDAGINNNFSAERLMTPDEVESFDTHTEIEGGKAQKSPNGIKPTVNQPAGAKAQASTKSVKASKVHAAEDDCLPNDSSNVSTLDNDVPPEEGYELDVKAPGDLDIVADADDMEDLEDAEDLEEVDDVDELDEITADSLEVPNAPANMLEADGEEDGEDDDAMEEQWDEEPAVEDDLLGDLGDEDGEVVDEDIEEDTEVTSNDAPADGEEVLNLVDVDEVSDTDSDDLAFASLNASVLVLHKDRVIAKMTKRAAVTAGCADMYQTDQFQDAVIAECRRYGLRAGLKSMGFTLATVSFSKANVTNKRIEAKVKAATAAVRRTFAQKDNSLTHCLAIAAVGINRNLWKDVPNTLKASLENALTSAGVRNARRLVERAFAQNGVEYAKSIVTLAQKLAAMPEATRNAFASALDMVDEDGNFQVEDATVEDIDYEDGPGADFVDAAEDEFDDDDVDASTVTAALVKAGRPARQDKGVLLTPRQTGYSVTASRVLNGDEPLTFNL